MRPRAGFEWNQSNLNEVLNVNSNYKFIDCDAHILEPAEMFERYLEPEFRAEMPRTWADYAGNPMGFRVEIRVPKRGGGEYVLPFGDDPVDAATVRNMFGGSQMTEEAAVGAANYLSNASARVPLPGIEEAYGEFVAKNFAPETYSLVLERTGAEYMVVYPTVSLLTCAIPELSAQTAAAYRRAYNNWLHDFCSAAGRRVLGAGQIDLRDAKEAAREARRCVKELGFKAITIHPAPVCEHRLYDAFYEPLWAELEDLNVPLAIHSGTGSPADTMLYHYASRLRTAQTTIAFTVGNMLACTALIMGGVLERHPRLRVVHLESGAGWVPFWLDRLGGGVHGGFRGLDILGLKLHPIEYFQRQCFISADPDDPGIAWVIDFLGDDNIVAATDFGHLEGRKYASAKKDILGLKGVSDESKRKIMWDNALRLYPIQTD